MMPSKLGTTLWTLLLASAIVVSAVPARADISVGVEVNVDTFYDTLDDDDGQWLELPHHGYVWSPRVDPDWRPYSRGHWLYTDDHGWYWDSEERFGWATYHYGRWHLDDEVGWVWVPGRRWGPAWVAWRNSDRQIGWAPLPPEAEWRDSGVSYVETFYETPRYRAYWNFCEPRYITEPSVYSYIAPPTQTIILFNQTRPVVNNYTVVNQTIINQGVPVQQIQRTTNRAVPVTKLALSNTAPKFSAGAHKPGGAVQAFVLPKPPGGATPSLAKPKTVVTSAQLNAARKPAGLAQALQSKAATVPIASDATNPVAPVDHQMSNGTKAAIGAAAIAGGAAIVAPHLKKSAAMPAHPRDRALAKKHTGAPSGTAHAGPIDPSLNAASAAAKTAARSPAQVKALGRPHPNHDRAADSVTSQPPAAGVHKVTPHATFHPTAAAGQAGVLRHTVTPRSSPQEAPRPAALHIAPHQAHGAPPPQMHRAAPPPQLRAAPPPQALRAAPPPAASRPVPRATAAAIKPVPPPPPALKKVVKKPIDPDHPQ